MTRFSLFNSPFLLGFDQFERTLDRVTKAAKSNSWRMAGCASPLPLPVSA